MDGIKIEVTGNIARVIEKPSRITTGTVGLPVEFTFDEQWDGLEKVAVFRAGKIVKTISNPEADAVVPWEVLVKPGFWLSVGVYGANDDGTVAIPTIWVNVRQIQPGTSADGDPSATPTPPFWKRIADYVASMVYGKSEIDTMLSKKAEIDDTVSSGNKTWSSSRIYGTIIENRTYANKYTDNKVAGVINDTTVSDKAWSSKNTVDKLCPTFEIKDVRVECEPLEGYPLEVVSDLYAGFDGNWLLVHTVDNKNTYYSVTLSGIGSEAPVSYNWNTGVLETNSGRRWQYNLETKTFTLIEDYENYMPSTILTIPAKPGVNIFTSSNSYVTVKGRLDPNKYWGEKLAEQEAIIAEQEAELAELNKQYELIEERTIIADTNKVIFDKDLSEVPYNFSAITVVVASTAASATAAVIFQPKDADKNYIFYHEHQNGLGTSARSCVFKARNDHGLCEAYSFSSHTGNANLYAERGYKGGIWRNVCRIDIATYPNTVLIPKDTVIKVYGIRG